MLKEGDAKSKRFAVCRKPKKEYHPRDMKALNSSQRKRLRKLAHHLDPVLQVGKNGLSEGFLQAVDAALDSHELIKIRFLARKTEKRDLAREISRRTKSETAGLIGHTLILYRRQQDPEKRRIRLG
jgi:RNA-binding protein